MNLNEFSNISDGFKTTEKMPVLFLGHGSPMNAVEENIFVQGFRNISKEIPKPNAIICISAHWLTEGTFVTAMENLPRLMDSGFSGGSVSTDGGTATYTLRAILLLSDGVQGDMDGRVIRLYREDGLWKISMSQLTGWLEEAS